MESARATAEGVPARTGVPGLSVAIATQVPLHRDVLVATFAQVQTIVVAPHEMGRAAGHVVVIDRLTADFDQYLSAAFARRLPVVVWGGYLHPSSVQALVRRGVDAYVSVIGSGDQLLDAVRTVRAGMSWLPALPPETDEGLTPGELRALSAYLLDHPTLPREAVARLLGISESTLKAHVANVRGRLDDNCGSRAGLRRALIARGWLTLPEPSPAPDPPARTTRRVRSSR